MPINPSYLHFKTLALPFPFPSFLPLPMSLPLHPIHLPSSPQSLSFHVLPLPRFCPSNTGTVAMVHFCNKGLLLSPGHRHWLFSLCEKLCARVSLGWQFTGMLLEESAPPDTLSAFPKVLTTSPLVAYFCTIILQPSIFFYLFICLV